MNGTPRQITVSLGISKRFSVEDIETFYDGIKLACEIYGVDIVGGDTTSSLTGFTVSVTCIGSANEDEIVYRNGAKDTDLISPLATWVLRTWASSCWNVRKVCSMAVATSTRFRGQEYLLERQLKPEARKDSGTAQEQGITPTSMIDISDGLSSDMLHICKQSNVGCQLFEERILLTTRRGGSRNVQYNVTTVALNGGEDYELLSLFLCTSTKRWKACPVCVWLDTSPNLNWDATS